MLHHGAVFETGINLKAQFGVGLRRRSSVTVVYFREIVNFKSFRVLEALRRSALNLVVTVASLIDIIRCDSIHRTKLIQRNKWLVLSTQLMSR
jgi:hypothetical protein